MEPQVADRNYIVPVPVGVVDALRQPAEQFADPVEIIGVDLLPGGQRPSLPRQVRAPGQRRAEHTTDPPGRTTAGQQWARLVLDHRLARLVLHHDRELGHDGQALRLRPDSQVPAQLGRLRLGELVPQIDRYRQLIHITHAPHPTKDD